MGTSLVFPLSLPSVKSKMVNMNFEFRGEFSMITISKSRECVDRPTCGSIEDERWRPVPTKPTLNPTITSLQDSSNPIDSTSRTITIEPAGDSLMVKAQVKGYSMQSDAQKWSTPPPGAAVRLLSAAQFSHNSLLDGTWSPTNSAVGSAVANPPQSHNPSGLKRPRSSSIAMESLPVAPKLRGDIILEVFTHRSLRFPGAPINEDSEFGDNERLAVLGEKVLELAVTFALFTKRPMLKSVELEVRHS